MSKKHKKHFVTLDYIEHFLILVSTIAQCIYFSAFASLVGIPIGITSSTIGLKACAFTATAGTTMHKVIIQTKKKKHDKIALLAKTFK